MQGRNICNVRTSSIVLHVQGIDRDFAISSEITPFGGYCPLCLYTFFHRQNWCVRKCVPPIQLCNVLRVFSLTEDLLDVDKDNYVCAPFCSLAFC